MTIDWKKTVEDKETELRDLYTRMDIDRNLRWGKDANGNDYQMYKEDGVTPVPSVRNVTMPDPKIHGNKVVSTLRTAELQPEITGKEITDKDASSLERMRKDFFALADRELTFQGIRGGLIGADAGQSAIRGWIVRKLWPYMDGDKFHTGLRAWDSRYCSWEYGTDDYNWACCRMTRTKAQIEREYPKVGELRSSEAEVLDIPTIDENIIYIAGEEYIPETGRRKNPWGRVPIIVEANANSDSLRDKGYMAHEGESIYAEGRDLYPLLNELATVLNTITVRSFLGNLQLETENPSEFKITVNPFGEREIVFLKTGEKISLIPINDIKQATRYLISMVEARLQRATLPATDFGNLSFTLSAVAIKALGESSNSVFLPLLDTMARSQRALTELMFEIWNLGDFHHDKIMEADKSLLSKKFDVNIKLYSISPLENIANYSVAEAASAWMKKDKVLADIIHDPNPAETLEGLMMQEAEQLSQRLMAYNRVMALLKKDPDPEVQAEILASDYNMSTEEIKSGNLNSGNLKPPPGSNGQKEQGKLLDLYNQAGKVAPGAQSSYQEAANLETQMGVENAI